MVSHFILYVRDQAASTSFYQKALNIEPRLNVPGMTEFDLGPSCVLGLMPESGIKSLLGEAIQHPERAGGVPRAEIYLCVDDPEIYFQRAQFAGATALSSVQLRNWGHVAGYLADHDGHVLAFAKPI